VIHKNHKDKTITKEMMREQLKKEKAKKKKKR